MELLSGGIDNPNSRIWSYARYWNGYVIFIKPLLLFLNLNGIRLLFTMLASLMLLSCTCLLARKRGFFAGIAFALPFFAVNYWVALMSLSLSFTILISLAASLYVLLRNESHHAYSASAWVLPFFAVGAITAYLDFLCTPLVTLGVPLSVLLFLGAGCRGARFRFKGVLALFGAAVICWAVGYGLLWASKWVISSLVLQKDVIADAVEQITLRTGDLTGMSSDAATMDSIFDSVSRNVSLLFPEQSIIILICLLVAMVVFVVINRFKYQSGQLAAFAMLIVASMLPYLWYLFASNHSYIHYWFTYRTQVVTLVSVLFALCIVGHPIISEGKKPYIPFGARHAANGWPHSKTA